MKAIAYIFMSIVCFMYTNHKSILLVRLC